MATPNILEMKPGAELNTLVAKRVMELDIVTDELMGEMVRLVDSQGDSVWGSVMPYSEDLDAAQKVVTEMLARGYSDAETWCDYGEGRYTAAEAICKRALIVLESSCQQQ